MSKYVDDDQLYLYFVQYPNVQITSTTNLKAGVFDNQANPLFWNTIKGINISISFLNTILSVETNSFFHFSNLKTFKDFTKLKNFIIMSYDAWYYTIPRLFLWKYLCFRTSYNL